VAVSLEILFDPDATSAVHEMWRLLDANGILSEAAPAMAATGRT
jgi:hypothetical protein